MREFPLRIVTPDSEAYCGMAQSLLVRTADGDVEFLAGHTDYMGAVAIGRVRIKCDSGDRYASANGGFISVSGGEVLLATTTFEFSEDIDRERAERAKENAEAALREAKTARETDLAKAKLMRAISRLNASNLK